ncbi:acyl dehydratase [Promicromonospora sp. AC04]|uniref:MaoC family dehydratase n=1 Tax=Promicromonospora sp. AC04 TaxID=2135723 RepID=UPI000D363AE6|nr:MaoC family dehydratase [Promicromonospora sp. AC04]PUB26012.1 acyl dehydratase [Promicromonospora sp. AC04]
MTPVPTPPETATAPTRVALADLPQHVGTVFGPSSWRTVSQEEVNDFADLTADHNPIHVDAEAAARSPFGGTIVHGYFTLSLLVPLMAEIFEVTGVATGINYGLDRLRFPAPVPVGARVRVQSTLREVTDVPGGYQTVFENVVEVEGQAKPGVVAVMVLRFLG